MITTIVSKIKLGVLTFILAGIVQNNLLSFVDAGSNSLKFRGDRRLNTLPERKPRIHGGWDSKEDRYSYAQVNLKWEDEGHQCGGSLVAPDMVLTAAHCVGSFDKIEIGKYQKNDITDESEIFESVIEIVHPDYNEETTRHDVMLIKLDGSSKLATPVRINSDETIPSNGSMLTVIGMGYNANWDLPNVFQETSVQYQINEQCEELVDEDNGVTLKGDLYPDMLCAGYDERDSCYGDSGSPLVLKGDDEQSDIQIGVVSWGYECAGDLPGIYGRLGYLPMYNFVEENVCLFSDNPPLYMNCDKWSMSPTQAPSDNPTIAPTRSPTITPSAIPTIAPTQTRSPTESPAPSSLASASPTTEKLKEALQNVFLEYDLTLKTTSNVEDALKRIESTEDPSSSAVNAFEQSTAFSVLSSARKYGRVFTLLSILGTFVLL